MFEQLRTWFQFDSSASPEPLPWDMAYLDGLKNRLDLLEQRQLYTWQQGLRALRPHFYPPVLTHAYYDDPSPAAQKYFRELRREYYTHYPAYFEQVVIFMERGVATHRYAAWILLNELERELFFTWMDKYNNTRRREILRTYALYLNLTRILCRECYQGPLYFQRHLRKAQATCAQYGVRLEDLVASPKLALALTFLSN